MKYLQSNLFMGLITILFLSCADYDLMEKSLHPDGPDLSIVNVSDTSVTLSWTRYAGEDFNSYKVYVSRNDAIDTTDSLADSLHFAIDTTKSIRGLNVGTLYYFRVMVTTKEGGIGASNIVDTTTILSMKGILKLYPPDTAQTTDSTVTLRWSTCISNFGTYKLYMDTTQNVDNKDTLVKTTYGDTIATVRGLQQDRSYWFRVYATLDTNVVAKSDGMVTRTTKNFQSVHLSVVDSTDTTVFLRWSQYRGADFRSYKVYFSNGPTVELGDSLYDSLTIRTDTVALVKFLRPGTAYSFRIMVMRLRGDPLPSNNESAITTNVQKTKITLLGPDQVTDTLVAFRWTKCTVDNAKYWIFQDSTIRVDTSSEVREASYPETSKVIGELRSSTVYWFRVYARKGGEYIASSDPMEILTKKK
jgi:hypothetical protein